MTRKNFWKEGRMKIRPVIKPYPVVRRQNLRSIKLFLPRIEIQGSLLVKRTFWVSDIEIPRLFYFLRRTTEVWVAGDSNPITSPFA
jgi:hypothetical protein